MIFEENEGKYIKRKEKEIMNLSSGIQTHTHTHRYPLSSYEATDPENKKQEKQKTKLPEKTPSRQLFKPGSYKKSRSKKMMKKKKTKVMEVLFRHLDHLPCFLKH